MHKCIPFAVNAYNRYLLMESGHISRNASQDYCEAEYGATLAVMSNQTEFDIVNDLLTANLPTTRGEVWIGNEEDDIERFLSADNGSKCMG